MTSHPLLSREQLDALKRDAMSQYDWLVLRRQEVVDQLPRSVPPESAPPQQIAAQLEAAHAALAAIDREMEELIVARMTEIRKALAALRRSRRALQGYRDRAQPPSTYVDGKS